MLRAMQARLLVAIALAALGACSYFQDTGQEEATIVRPGNFRKGSGVITAVSVLPNANNDKAQPRASGRKPDPNLHHVELQMDGHGFQAGGIDTATSIPAPHLTLPNTPPP